MVVMEMVVSMEIMTFGHVNCTSCLPITVNSTKTQECCKMLSESKLFFHITMFCLFFLTE